MVSSSPKKDTSLWVKNQGKLTTSNASMALFGHALAVSSDSLTLSPKNSKIISGRSGTLFTPIIDHYSFRTTQRQRLFYGLEKALNALASAGCQQVFLDGSYVTAKPNPKNYDLCWDPRGVDPDKLDPVLWHPQFLTSPRAEQQERYHGDFFQAFAVEGSSGMTFLDFFQCDKHSGQRKGIVNIKLEVTL